jgi:hypothetical protein
MLTRSAYLVKDRVYPLALLFVGLVLTVGWIGFLGYGLLTLMATDPFDTWARLSGTLRNHNA